MIAYSSRKEDILAKNTKNQAMISLSLEKTLSPASFDTFRGVSEKREEASG